MAVTHKENPAQTDPTAPSILILAVTLLLSLTWSEARARTWVVAQDGTGDLSSVAAACEAAAAGDSIRIRPGVYREEGHDDPMDPEIVLTEKPLSILGDGPAETVSLQMKFAFVDCDGVILSNLTLHDVNRAIYIADGWDSSARYLVRSCRFENNKSLSNGGGAILANTGVSGSLVIEESAFKGNEYLMEYGINEGGGAVYASSANTTVRRCIFQDNHALRHGGAVFALGNITIENCLFLRNSSPHGAAVALGYGDLTITRSTFYRNDCLGEVGGAVEIFGDHLGSIPDQCIIAETVGAAVECPVSASAHCCDLWMNSLDPDPWCGAEVRYGNFSEDPLFCDPDGGDFGLQAGSPCLPGQHGGFDCGLIGSGTEECGLVPTRPTTWGRIKLGYR